MHERHATPNLKSTDILISGYLDLVHHVNMVQKQLNPETYLSCYHRKKTQLTKFTFQDIKRLTLFTFRSTLVHKLCHFWGIPTATGKVSLVIMYNRGTDKHFFSSS